MQAFAEKDRLYFSHTKDKWTERNKMSKKKDKTKEQGPQPKLDKHYNIAETERKLQDLWASEEHY